MFLPSFKGYGAYIVDIVSLLIDQQSDWAQRTELAKMPLLMFSIRLIQSLKDTQTSFDERSLIKSQFSMYNYMYGGLSSILSFPQSSMLFIPEVSGTSNNQVDIPTANGQKCSNNQSLRTSILELSYRQFHLFEEKFICIFEESRTSLRLWIFSWGNQEQKEEKENRRSFLRVIAEQIKIDNDFILILMMIMPQRYQCKMCIPARVEGNSDRFLQDYQGRSFWAEVNLLKAMYNIIMMKAKAIPYFPATPRLPQAMTTSMTLQTEFSPSNPQKQGFIPLKPLYHLNPLKKEPILSNSQHYRSFQKLRPQADNLFDQKGLRPLASNMHSPTNKITQKQKIQQNKVKLLRIKEQYMQNSIQNMGAIRPIRNENKPIPFFLKKSPSNNPTNNIFPQTSFCTKKAVSPNKLILKSGQPLPQSNHQLESKFLTINGLQEQFHVLKYLDEGSYGKVYLVQHKSSKMIYCLKMVKKRQLDEASQNQLIRQLKIQSFLNHPNIVNLYSFSADSQFVYLLLQPCLEENLYKKIKHRPLEEKDVRKSIKEVCVALEYMHRNNIIHRDIKPQNVLVHQGTVKLCDFGWAVHSPLLRNTQCGTPVYTPPEMVKCEFYDSKIDIWCIGVLTYELLYGNIPFEIKSTQDLVKILEQQIRLPSDIEVTDQGKDFIFRCMAKNPVKRLNIRQVLEHDFLTKRIEKFRHTMS